MSLDDDPPRDGSKRAPGRTTCASCRKPMIAQVIRAMQEIGWQPLAVSGDGIAR